jgi:glycosyltransferase involved in cell wall biosynthesis
MISVKNKHIPFFSVIVTCHNRAHILERALESLLKQEMKDWECLIVNDGSSDSTDEIVQSWVNKDDRFRYLKHSHRGQALTKNAGILASSGLFITFLDSDDEYMPDHLSMRKAMLEEYPYVDLLHGGVTIVGDQFVPDMHDSSNMIHLSDCIIGGTFVFSKSAILTLNGFDNISYGDDTTLYEKAEQAGMNIARTDYPSYVYYRDMPDSLCNIKKVQS